MADKAEIGEARRIAKDLSQQVMDANTRLITGTDPQGRDVGISSKSDSFIRDSGNLLTKKLVDKYKGDIAKDYSSKGDFSSYDLIDRPSNSLRDATDHLVSQHPKD